jgi:hypothetical protein
LAQGLEAFLLTYAFLGIAVGMAAGAASAWLPWPPSILFVAALLVTVGAAMMQDLIAGLDFEGALAAILLAPLVAALPVGAGFVVGRRFVLRSREKR